MLLRTISSVRKRMCTRPARQSPSEGAIDRQRADAFMADLSKLTRQTGHTTHAFCIDEHITGYVQLHRSGATVMIHRIWTSLPGNGHGSQMLRSLCELADRHQVTLQLKVLPLGAKPYPMSADALRAWYIRYGFSGSKKLVRHPLRSEVVC